MINYSERPDLPAVILAALQDNAYYEELTGHMRGLPPDIQQRAQYYFSTTTLIRAPRQRVLFQRHSHRVTVDPLAGFHRMMGHVVHSILEKYASGHCMIENRLGAMSGNAYIHGKADLYDPETETLSDYKTGKAESMLYGAKPENVAQLNVLRWIWEKNGYIVNKLENIHLFLNWSSRLVKEGSAYPVEQVVTVPVPVWDDKRLFDYIEEQVDKHIRAEEDTDDRLPFCTDQERWVGSPLYKVIKLNPDGSLQKIAKYRADSRQEAQSWLAAPENKKDAKGKPLSYVIKEIKAQPARCGWCEVSAFCNQRQTELREENMEEYNE